MHCMTFCLVSQTQGSRATPEDCNFQTKLRDEVQPHPLPLASLGGGGRGGFISAINPRSCQSKRWEMQDVAWPFQSLADKSPKIRLLDNLET